MSQTTKFTGALLGLAIGDAVGTTAEFKPRGSFPPVTDMVGKGPFNLKPGEWTDDTSMALCLATSLVEKQGFDADDQMQRYCAWFETGYLSSNGRCFDIGITTSEALRQYRHTGYPFSGSTDPFTAGNGCIMRLAPVPMFYHKSLDDAVHYSGEGSRTTHGAAECVEASRLFGVMLFTALQGADKEAILSGGATLSGLSRKIQQIATGTYRTKSRAQINGNGYVVNSLEAALWCFDQTDTYRDAVLMATNLGDDTDTTAAICGQVAGAYYGEEGIPVAWRERVVMGDEIRTLAIQLMALGQ
ncbi:MAG: ADP-ribosylglycohydrolase family protein [Chloroflexota bacterium]